MIRLCYWNDGRTCNALVLHPVSIGTLDASIYVIIVMLEEMWASGCTERVVITQSTVNSLNGNDTKAAPH